MSCTKCETEPIETYVRVGNGNVKIVGCEPHLYQLIEQNRRGMKLGDTTNVAITYEQLQREAMEFLAHCGQLTMLEQSSPTNPATKTSVNEILGLATRVAAEQALNIQVLADNEEAKA